VVEALMLAQHAVLSAEQLFGRVWTSGTAVRAELPCRHESRACLLSVDAAAKGEPRVHRGLRPCARQALRTRSTEAGAMAYAHKRSPISMPQGEGRRDLTSPD
jgi:hypothetical protein